MEAELARIATGSGSQRILRQLRERGSCASPSDSSIEATGGRCWIAPRDVRERYDREIVAAIKSIDGFVLVFSGAAGESPHVLNEVSIATTQRKRLVPIKTGAGVVPEEFEYHLARVQWIEWSGDPSPQLADRVVARFRTA